MEEVSRIGDLTPLMDDIQEVFKKHFPDEKSAVALAFALERNFAEVHWCTNVSRKAGIEIFKQTAHKMTAEIN